MGPRGARNTAMTDIRFTEDHEWVRLQDGEAVVGISQYAQDTLGEIVFVDLPAPGRDVAQGAEAVVVESVKAASEIYAPVSGRIVEVNSRLEEEPGLLNSDPRGAGWLFRMELADKAEFDALMDEDAYARFVDGLE